MLFERFRPTSHFIAPHSWSNDPCGACYIPETKEYIICYQWNPGTVEGGNCAWGMAKSKDLVFWEDCAPALRNGESYDSLGVFSGSIVSRLLDGKRILFLFYTSVSALPIHWSKPYLPGCESQSVAYSVDFGKTWKRWQNNPLLSRAPRATATTGWRDPFVSQWTSLSSLIGLNCETNYMLIASGEKNQGPQLQIYKSDALFDGWEYLSAILDVKNNTVISERSTLLFGPNFECASFFSLNGTNYILVGVEESPNSNRHSCRYTLWLSGTLVLEGGMPRFLIDSHGILDHGILYAPHIFRDAQNKVIQLGWADEDTDQQVVNDQGWAGCLALPRELFQITKPFDHETFKHSTEWTVDEETCTMTTLGIAPARPLDLVRSRDESLSLKQFTRIRSATFEISAKFSGLLGSERFVFNIRQSPGAGEVTRIIIDAQDDSITVDRSRTSMLNLGTSTPDAGRFKLLPGEDLDVRIFVDVSIVEVYANSRFALTSRIYPSLGSSIYASYDFGHYDQEKLSFMCWDQLRDAWPTRKAAQIASLSPSYSTDSKQKDGNDILHDQLRPAPGAVSTIA